jgi:spore maturation protein CgeB
MKVVVFGLTISSSWGNGHATLWRALARAWTARGDRVTFFEKDAPYYAANRDLHEIDGGRLVLYPDWSVALPVARRELADADVAIVTSYCPDGPRAARLLEDEARCITVFYDMDTPVTLAALASGQPVDYLPAEGLGHFDLVLSYTGGTALEQLRTRLGARRVATLYGSVDPERHHRVDECPAYRCHLSYLGTFAADRQAALQRLFVEPARRLPERRFVLGGAQYPQDFPWTRNIHFVRHLPPGEHNALYSSSRATLNVTRAAMAAMGHCPSGRLFEAAACATPVLTDAWEGLESFFEPGIEILTVDDAGAAAACLEIADHELARIGRAARERVLAEHTARHRVVELEATLAAVAARRAPRTDTGLPAAGHLTRDRSDGTGARGCGA